MSAFDRLSRMCGPQVPPELLAELAAHRAEDEAALTSLRAMAMAAPAAAPVPVKTAGHCTAEYGGPGYTHCELTAGHDGQHESAIGNMHHATWGGVS